MAKRKVIRSLHEEHFTQWTIVLSDRKSYTIRYYPSPDTYTSQWVVMSAGKGNYAEGSDTYGEVMAAFKAWRAGRAEASPIAVT